jgi:hypothetical protein
MIAKYNAREDNAPPLHFFCWLLAAGCWLLAAAAAAVDCRGLCGAEEAEASNASSAPTRLTVK